MGLEFNLPTREYVKTTNAKLYEEDDHRYLELCFKFENDNGVYEGHINKIPFDITISSIEQCSSNGLYGDGFYVYTNLSSKMKVFRDNNGDFMTIKCIEEKVHEMTIEEIEKKLGYKVSIVGNK